MEKVVPWLMRSFAGIDVGREQVPDEIRTLRLLFHQASRDGTFSRLRP
jgi:hypothetical protein